MIVTSRQNGMDGLTDFFSTVWSGVTDLMPNVVSITGQVLQYKTAQETAAAQQAVAAAQQAAIDAANARARQQQQAQQQTYVVPGAASGSSNMNTYMIMGGIGLIAVLLLTRGK